MGIAVYHIIYLSVLTKYVSFLNTNIVIREQCHFSIFLSKQIHSIFYKQINAQYSYLCVYVCLHVCVHAYVCVCVCVCKGLQTYVMTCNRMK